MDLPELIHKVLSWLHAGYPEGLPEADYIPLFALLGTTLTDDEVAAIAAELENESTPDCSEAIRRAIIAATDHQPNDADIARVRARLAAGGWPLAPPDRSARASA